MRRAVAGGIKNARHERGDWDAMCASLFHFVCRDREDVSFDPRPSELGAFSGTEHREKRPNKEHLHPARCVLDDLHDVWEFSPVDGGHWRRDWGSKDPAQTFNRIVLYVAGANGKVEDFTSAHEDALERHASTGGVQWQEDLDDERRCDLVELPVADVRQHMVLEHPAFVFVANDTAFLEAHPELEGVIEDVPARRFKPDFLPGASCFLTCLFQRNVGPMPKRTV